MKLITLDVMRTARHIAESSLEHVALMAGKTLDVIANIAETKAENDARRGLENTLQRAKRVIMGARAIAASLVGLEATEELLLNEAAETREQLRHEAMVRGLRSGVRTSFR